MKWEPGRQGGGYRKLLLAKGRRWDLYVIDCPPGSQIPWHTDPVTPGVHHWRANLRIIGENAFRVQYRAKVFRLGRLVVFRPDVWKHRVGKVHRRRIMLSFGLALDARP